jgi:hypothetical protein
MDKREGGYNYEPVPTKVNLERLTKAFEEEFGGRPVYHKGDPHDREHEYRFDKLVRKGVDVRVVLRAVKRGVAPVEIDDTNFRGSWDVMEKPDMGTAGEDVGAKTQPFRVETDEAEEQPDIGAQTQPIDIGAVEEFMKNKELRKRMADKMIGKMLRNKIGGNDFQFVQFIEENGAVMIEVRDKVTGGVARLRVTEDLEQYEERDEKGERKYALIFDADGNVVSDEWEAVVAEPVEPVVPEEAA